MLPPLQVFDCAVLVGTTSATATSMPASLVGGDWDTAERWQGGPTSPGTGIIAIREAVKQGLDVNEADEHGRTPLINAAAYTWDPEIVPYLISQGADVHATDAQGRTALHHVTSSNNTAAAAGIAQACCAAGADPNAKDGSGASAFATAKKKRNPAVLAVLEAVLAAPKPVTAEQMEEVRALPWFAGWRRCVIQAIDKCFDADASAIELLGVTGEADLDAALAALMDELESAYKSGEMGGGTFRQVSLVRLGAEALAKKLSNLDDELFVVIVACPAGKHDTASKKVAKYGSGSKVIAAWADKAAC